MQYPIWWWQQKVNYAIRCKEQLETFNELKVEEDYNYIKCMLLDYDELINKGIETPWYGMRKELINLENNIEKWMKYYISKPRIKVLSEEKQLFLNLGRDKPSDYNWSSLIYD